MSQGQRRLAAIMFTDMAGYTALGQKNESRSLALVETQKKLIRPILRKHEGREVKTMGDAFLVEFPNALDAVRCAYEIQRATREYNIPISDDERLHLRIGLHLGDVTKSEGDILGDTVNVASRIESLAEDGGVCVTRQVYDQVKNKFELPLESLGEKSLKNVSEPVEVYRMLLPWQTAQQAPKKLETTRIAVLPFANMSPDPNDSYFADGITEEIISTLSGISGLNVISRTSVMGYKGTTKKVKEIGSELEAGSVLEGSFRKAGNRIRVTTQLITVEKDQHVWTQSYDRNLDDVFAVQTDIAKQVADALRVRVLPPEVDRIDKKPTESTKAYALYLRGRYHWSKRGIEEIRKAENYFEQAVKEDSRFALGYVGLADCHMLLHGNYGMDYETNYEKAKNELTKALDLDAALPEAHASRGEFLATQFSFREAEKEFREAIELKSSYATAHHWYAILLRSQTRWEEALQEIERAVKLDPFSPIINLNHARYYFLRRDYGKALELFQKTIELDPSFAIAHAQLAWLYGRLKRFDDMKREVKAYLQLVQETFPLETKAMESAIALFEGDKERVRTLLAELESHLGESPSLDAFNFALLHFYLGEIDKGFEWLERSYARKEYDLLSLKRGEEELEAVRTDPRYQSLLMRLGL